MYKQKRSPYEQRIENLRRLIDYVLLNAPSLSFSGLYRRRAGLALCLFEASRFFKEEALERHATRLLQQALLARTTDITYENGLAGIGCALGYLIQYHFVEADFEELFQEQALMIAKEFGKTSDDQTGIRRSLQQMNVSRFFIYWQTLPNKVKVTQLYDQLFHSAAVSWEKAYDMSNKMSMDILQKQWGLLLASVNSYADYRPDIKRLYLILRPMSPEE